MPATAEERLVAMACAIAPRRLEHEPAMRALVGEVDADRLLAVLERHHLTALAGTRLAAVDALPDALAEAITSRVSDNRVRALHHATVGRRVAAALEAERIPALVLKGFALADDVHTDAGLRRYGDIDLLVPTPALGAAAAVLGGHGYRPYPRPGEDALNDLHLEMYDPAGRDPVVELHWRIHWVDGGFAAAMLERSGLADGLRRADPVDELAALLLFFARDGFVGLRLAADIAAWWDARSASVGPRPLDALGRRFGRLGALWWTSARAAEAVVGLPADRLMTPVAAGRRSRIALRLINWPGTGDGDQLAADVALINLLLAPAADLPAIARRHVFISRWRTEDFYALPPGSHARRRLLQVAHPVKVLVRSAWALRRAARG